MTTPPRAKLRHHWLVRQGSWSLVCELLMLVGMTVTFAVLPLKLSETPYGIAGSVQGLVTPAMQIGILGAPALMIRRVTHGESLAMSWNRLVTSNVYGSVVTTLLLVAVQPWLLRNADLVSFALLIVAYGFLTSIGDQVFLVYQSQNRMDKAALTRAMTVAPRVVATLVFYFFGSATLVSWALHFFVACGVSAVVCLWYVRADEGLTFRVGAASDALADARKSYGYAMTGASDSVLNVSDRPIMANNHPVEAGSYTLAYRFVSLALMPSLAVIRAVTPRQFASGKDGIGSSTRMAVTLVPVTAGLGLVVAGGLWLGAPLVRVVIGNGYDDTVTIIRWLAVVPLIKSMQYLVGNALDAAHQQIWRFRFTLVAAALNVGLNLALIPRYSFRAAVGTTIVAEGLLTAMMWTWALWLARRDPERGAATGPEFALEAV